MVDVRTKSPSRFNDELAAALYHIFITQNKYDLKKVIAKYNLIYDDIELEYADLYAYISGRRTIPVELLKRLVVVTEDKYLLDTVFAGSPITWSWRSNVHKHTNDAIKELLKVHNTMGKISDSFRAAADKGSVSSVQAEEILKLVSQTQKELNNLSDCVQSVKEKR